MSSKINLLGQTREQLDEFFAGLGEKKFRTKQIMQWIYQRQVVDFDLMTDLSIKLREKLKDVATLAMPQVVLKDLSTDGTRKFVIELEGGNRVEAVFIPEGQRGTLCVSSQVGCALDCKFCSTGKQGFFRDLTAAEIIAQVWIAAASFGVPENLGHRPVTNIVMMGMGEPLLNFKATVDAMHVMLDDFAYGVSKRRLTLSNSGIAPKIIELGDHIDVSLALSLHAPNDELRNQIVPVNKKYPIAEVLDACRNYLSRFSTRKQVIIEYVLLDNVNDKFEHAHEMVELLKDFPCKINLIPFNPFPHSGFKRPSSQRIQKFKDILSQAGFTTTVRTTRGEDIDAACGQLVGQVVDRTKRSEEWQAAVWKKMNPAPA
jgi:23S rRNA (adenine2503-C2)-methyltransferase